MLVADGYIWIIVWRLLSEVLVFVLKWFQLGHQLVCALYLAVQSLLDSQGLFLFVGVILRFSILKMSASLAEYWGFIEILASVLSGLIDWKRSWDIVIVIIGETITQLRVDITNSLNRAFLQCFLIGHAWYEIVNGWSKTGYFGAQVAAFSSIAWR